jgi:hypothetical protein
VNDIDLFGESRNSLLTSFVGSEETTRNDSKAIKKIPRHPFVMPYFSQVPCNEKNTSDPIPFAELAKKFAASPAKGEKALNLATFA